METSSTPKKNKSAGIKEILLVILGAVLGAALGYAGNYYFDKTKEPGQIIIQRRDSTWHQEQNQKADTANMRLKNSNQQLSQVIAELQAHSELITEQTRSLATGINDLQAAYKSPTVDPSNVSRITDNLSASVRALVSANNNVSQRAEISKEIAEIYEDRLKLPTSLQRVVLPRGSKITVAQPIDDQYYIGVQGEYAAGATVGITAVFDGRHKNIQLADTALIYTAANGIIKITLEKIDETAYVFGVNRLKR